MKKAFPEEDELVLCTVTSVQYHSVFCKLDEYDKVGMIHISEIAPGRIKNIREYVQEGKKVVCKVLSINTERGHIDLSLRRVSEAQKRNKLNSIKQEQLAEKIIEQAAIQKKTDPAAVNAAIAQKLLALYPSVYSAFEAVVAGTLKLEDAGIEPAIAAAVEDVVKSRIKPPQVTIAGDLKITSYAPDGVTAIRDALAKAEAISPAIVIRSKGAGTYHILVTAPDYKEAERIMKEAVDAALSHAKKHKANAEFERVETD